MTRGTRDHDKADTESEHPKAAATPRDGSQDRIIAHGAGDHEAYANLLRGQPGAAHHGAAALHAQFGNAYAMQVMERVEGGGGQRGHGEGGAHDVHDGSRPLGGAKTLTIAEFEKQLTALRNRYDARMRALSDTEVDMQNNPGMAPGDPLAEHKVNEPIVSGNRLLADTKQEIQNLEDAKSHEKAGSSRWNKLNNMQQELIKSGHILWEQEYRFHEALKKRGFKPQNLEPFP